MFQTLFTTWSNSQNIYIQPVITKIDQYYLEKNANGEMEDKLDIDPSYVPPDVGMISD
jgi:hypothetical protein